MTTERGHGVLPHARALFDVGSIAGLTDPELLDRFTNRGGEASELAFAAIVERHGPMVLRVCRRALSDREAAHDAFQATFLVLATKAGSLRRRESLASWLHGVALRVARCARSAAVRRQSHERRKAEEAPAMIDDGAGCIDDGAVVREEFDRLPDRYREAIALCDLDDLTHEEAADRLGWPVGTVKSRLARGRARLRERLARRGLVPASVVPMMSFPSESVRAIPPALVDGLARAASKIAAGTPMAGMVPASTEALVQGVRRMMLKDAIRAGATAALAFGILATGLAIAAQGPPRAPGPATAPAERLIAISTRFCDLGKGGLAWRETPVARRFRLVGMRPPFTIWAVDRETTLPEFLANCLSRPDAAVTQAPKVSSFEGAPATIFNTVQRSFPIPGMSAGPRPAPDRPARGAFTSTYQGPGRDALISKAAHTSDPKTGRINEGVTIDLVGRRVDAGVLAKLSIANTHVIAVHDAVLPGNEAEGKPARVQVPEIAQARLDGEWIVDDKEALIVSLGLERTADEDGKTTLCERLVILETWPVELPIGLHPQPATIRDGTAGATLRPDLKP